MEKTNMKVFQTRTFYLFIAICGLASILFRTFTVEHLGILNSDPISYFTNAYLLPNYNRSLFPVGYSVLLRIGNVFFENYLLTSKVIAILGYCFIVLFSYFKNFLFRETVVTMCFAGILSVFSTSISETVFLPFLYYYFYLRYQEIEKQKKVHFLPILISFTCLLFIRYFAIFIIPAEILFLLVLYWKNRSVRNTKIQRQFLLVASLFFGVFLLFGFNYYFTGSFMGENVRNQLLRPLAETLKGALLFFNPFMEQKDSTNMYTFFISYGVPIMVILGIFFIFYKKRNHLTLFMSYTLIISGILIFFLYVSALITNLQVISYRLQSPITLVFFVGTLHFFRNQKYFNQMLFIIPIFSLFFFNFYTQKNRFNYQETINYYQQKIPKIAHCEEVILQTPEKNPNKTLNQRLALTYLLFEYRIQNRISFNPLFRIRKDTLQKTDCSVESYQSIENRSKK